MDWHRRERRRGEANKYRLVPWAGEWWSTTEASRYHFPRIVGRVTKCEVGYCDRNGKVCKMRPGRYLRKFYKHVLSPAQIKHWVDEIGLIDTEVFFAHSPEEITKVYEEGPKSCMSKKFPKEKFHPCSAYGAGDLAIAYLKKGKRITARVICWPEKKVFCVTGVYGDQRIKSALVRAGYQASSKNNKEFRGARLLALPVAVGFLVPDICVRNVSRLQLCDDGYLRLRSHKGEWECSLRVMYNETEAKAAGVELAKC